MPNLDFRLRASHALGILLVIGLGTLALWQGITWDEPLLRQRAFSLLRMQPLVNSVRLLTTDLEWHGVRMKAGDTVMCYNSSGNFDPAQFANPHSFDPERKANRHFTFVGGVHMCLGAHLARRELRVLLEEWFTRIPQPFRIKPGTDTTVVPGLLSVRNLPIVWEVG